MIRSSLKNNSGEEFSYVSNRPIESGAPLFIFFHATGFNGQTYWQLIKGLDSLFEEEINFMSLDQRGHGHTKAEAIPEKLNSWSPFIEDALEIVDKMDGPIFCAGHSMGAIVAAKIAKLREEKVKKLVMLEPVLYSPYECFKYSFKRRWGLGRNAELVELASKRRRNFNSREEMINSYYGRGVFSTWEKSWITDYVEGGSRKISEQDVELTCSPEWESRTFMASDMGSWPYLKKLNTPTLILSGNKESTFTPNARKTIEKLGSNWKMEVFPDATHSLPMELSETLIDRIYQFMSK